MSISINIFLFYILILSKLVDKNLKTDTFFINKFSDKIIIKF